ncbi:helix-turn-helix domain-containing protein [Microbulbifer halophilus]|uniref:Helix-turn-helix domain-containing protein n=1 Tax=Microbulbifer halophilus TaxID=453963 RepID=A0ABW5E9H1_9GAMM|nr:helix-turn-helix transcriptional regulator [Microbulbifer halophilus]MCW8125680.1 helix-turn-helix transcriptional regulator [Microbulbifer halophilus]
MGFLGKSDRQILQTLGERLHRHRLHRDITQEQLAERAGLSVSTIKGLEAGRGRLDSLIAVLRELGQLDGLEAFLPDPGISPLQLAERQGRPRQRASRVSAKKKPPAKNDKPESDW